MPKKRKEKAKKQKLKSERPKQIDDQSPSKTSLSSLDSPMFSKRLLKPEKLETI